MGEERTTLDTSLDVIVTFCTVRVNPLREERSSGSQAGGGWEASVVRQAVRANLLESDQALQKLTQAETASKRNELDLLPKPLTSKLARHAFCRCLGCVLCWSLTARMHRLCLPCGLCGCPEEDPGKPCTLCLTTSDAHPPPS